MPCTKWSDYIMITIAFTGLLIIHGLIHLLGVAKAFRPDAVPQLTQPISPVMGLWWLIAALLFIVAAVALPLWPRWWWLAGAGALVVSAVVIVQSWHDARWGLIANLVVLVGVVCSFFSQGPNSLVSAYERDVTTALSRRTALELVTETDLESLPAPVQRYLRRTGVVGNPRIVNFRVRMHGRIRSGPGDPWMPLRAEQYNFVGEPRRFFYLSASKFGIPIQGYHRYLGTSASMRIKAAGLLPIITVSGAEMAQSETVTVFNDMCLMAPGTLIDPAIRWEAVDSRTARVHFASAGHVIAAELSFNEAGELTNFRSDDRYQMPADGGPGRRLGWSTPVSGYRVIRGHRMPSGGAARWCDAAGDYAYIELAFDDIQYNVPPVAAVNSCLGALLLHRECR
jgi:hypothetical protein